MHVLDTALHFTFYRNDLKMYSVMIMETLRFYVFFLVSYYFTKKAATQLTVSVVPPPPPQSLEIG